MREGKTRSGHTGGIRDGYDENRESKVNAGRIGRRTSKKVFAALRNGDRKRAKRIVRQGFKELRATRPRAVTLSSPVYRVASIQTAPLLESCGLHTVGRVVELTPMGLVQRIGELSARSVERRLSRWGFRLADSEVQTG